MSIIDIALLAIGPVGFFAGIGIGFFAGFLRGKRRGFSDAGAGMNSLTESAHNGGWDSGDEYARRTALGMCLLTRRSAWVQDGGRGGRWCCRGLGPGVKPWEHIRDRLK